MIQNSTYPTYLQEALPNNIVILNATWYYRWSTTGQIKERQLKNNHIEIIEKEETIKEVTQKCLEAITGYKGFCSKCHKEIRLMFAGDGYFDKGISGRKHQRENIDRLIEDAEENKFQVVITPFSSRLGRRLSVTATIRDELKDFGVQIYSLHQPLPLKCTDCHDPLDDDTVIINSTISDMQSELELASIRRNYKNGMPIRIKKGKPAGSLPYGLLKKYNIGKDNKGSELVETYYEWDIQTKQIVMRIAKEFLDGTGTLRIAHGLNLEDIPSPQGKEWSRTAILLILRNPAYAGVVRWRWKISKKGKRIIQPRENWMLEKAEFDGIWNMDYYEKIQEELARRKRIGGRAVSSTALLIGLLKCGYCKQSMFQTKTDRIQKNGNPYHFRGYGCGSYYHQGMCKSNGKNQIKIDKAVLHEVSKLFNETTKKSFMQKLQHTKRVDVQKQYADKKKALENLVKEFDRVTIAYKKGVDSLTQYAQNKKHYEPLIATVNEELKTIAAKLQRVQQNISLEASYHDAIQKFMDYPSPEDKTKVRVILSRIIDTIEFKKQPFSVRIYYKLE